MDDNTRVLGHSDDCIITSQTQQHAPGGAVPAHTHPEIGVCLGTSVSAPVAQLHQVEVMPANKNPSEADGMMTHVLDMMR